MMAVSPHNAFVELFGEEEPTVDDAPLQLAAPLRYRVLTGPDDRRFCERVSEALADGYELWGPPAVTSHNGQVIVAQAVVLAEEAQP